MTMQIRLTTFSPTALCRHAGSEVDDVLASVTTDAYAWVHVVQGDNAASTRVLEHFGLPRLLAQHLNGPAPLELDTSSDRYLLKKFRFVEPASVSEPGADRTATEFLIRAGEADGLLESSGSVIVGDRFMLLFEDHASPTIGRAVDAILHKERDVRERGIDYLMYRLAKAVFVDNYSSLLRGLTDHATDLEAKLLDGALDTPTYREITSLRRKLNPFARSLAYMAEFTDTVRGEEPDVFSQGGLSYLLENLRADGDRLKTELAILRDTTLQLIQMYRDNVNTQLNNIMRTLTAISAMFLPLSFITSFYGMNFRNMPALESTAGFFVAILLMVSIVVASSIYARRHKWI